MLKSKNSLNNKGFTIIELMIVLAIAGFILGMVLLAIPALQQNSRNNLRKQDVATILAAISRYSLNNSGAFPQDNNLDFLTSNYKLYYYSATADPSEIFIDARTNENPDNLNANTNLDTVKIYNYAKCDAATKGAAISRGAGYDDAVALFATESGRGNVTPQCQKL